MTDDVLLLRRYVEERSEAAFAELVRRHVNLVYSAALRRTGGNQHQAADVAQQVFSVLARDAARLVRHPVLAAWLYAATRNASLKLTRSEHRRRQRETEAQRMQLNDRCDPAPDWETLRPVIDQAMDQIGDTDRSAILLRFFDQRAFSEIGAALNLSTDAARMRTERALEKLRGVLVRRGINSSSAALGLALAERAVTAAPATMVAAITGKAVVVAGPAGFLMTKQAVVVAIVMVGAVGTGVYRWNEIRRTDAHAAAFGREPSVVSARLREAGTTVARAERGAAEAANAFESQKPKTVPAGVVAHDSAGAVIRAVGTWTDAGNATPAAAYESVFWAKEHLDHKRLASLIYLSPWARKRAEEVFAAQTDSVVTQLSIQSPDEFVAFLYATSPLIKGFRIIDETRTEPDLATILSQLELETGRKVFSELKFRNEPDGWRLEVDLRSAELVMGNWRKASGKSP